MLFFFLEILLLIHKYSNRRLNYLYYGVLQLCTNEKKVQAKKFYQHSAIINFELLYTLRYRSNIINLN